MQTGFYHHDNITKDTGLKDHLIKQTIQKYDNAIKCSFAEINDLASKIEMKNTNTDKSKYKFQDSDLDYSLAHNCTCSIQVKLFD